MFRRKSDKNNSWIWVVSTVVLGLSVIALLAYISVSGRNETANNTTQTQELKVTQDGGTVAVLGQSQPRPETQGALPTATYSEEPYSFKLPAGWKQTNDNIQENPCGEGKEWKTSTYSNGPETVIVYENGTPGGCDESSKPDLYLDFDFINTDSAIKVNDEVDLTFCTKQQHPDCPKGDGKITLFVGNKKDDSEIHTINKVNGNTYFFKIDDTKIDGDLAAQTKSLVKLIELIKFN